MLDIEEEKKSGWKHFWCSIYRHHVLCASIIYTAYVNRKYVGTKMMQTLVGELQNFREHTTLTVLLLGANKQRLLLHLARYVLTLLGCPGVRCHAE